MNSSSEEIDLISMSITTGVNPQPASIPPSVWSDKP